MIDASSKIFILFVNLLSQNLKRDLYQENHAHFKWLSILKKIYDAINKRKHEESVHTDYEKPSTGSIFRYSYVNYRTLEFVENLKLLRSVLSNRKYQI